MDGIQVKNGSEPSNLSHELLKRAESEIGEKEAWRDRDVQALREILTSKNLLHNF